MQQAPAIAEVTISEFMKVHLWDSYIRAKESGDESKCKEILCIIEQEEQTSMGRRINQAVDKPLLGAILFVQYTENGQVIDTTDTPYTPRLPI